MSTNLKYCVIAILISTCALNAQDLSVMTYNIKLDSPKEGEDSWTNRKPFLINLIKFHEPDVLGVQEAMPNQMKDMDSLLTQYNFVGVGRDDGEVEGEYSAIFYKKKKFNVLESSTFWLSQTPDIVSMGWDAVCNRICTYALFQNRITNQKFLVFNTHFDHVGEQARKESALLILKKIKEINTLNLPVILMGDFNLEAQSEGIKSILKSYNDTHTIANISFGPTGTFNGFQFEKPVTRKIDFVFTSKNITVLKSGILSDSKDCKYPSDHFPVYVEINLE
jgi:endonuclease/exonuclease/phosphatase family metal-dependent hydrolase